MAFVLPLSDLTKEEKQRVLKKFVVQGKKTHYDPTPPQYQCFTVNKQEDSLFLPLGAWKDYFDPNGGFPNGEAKDFPRMNPRAKFRAKLFTAKTDPKGRGRDQDVVTSQALKRLETEGVVFISCFTGYGKCLGPGTEVLMFNGTKKVVEDIRPGELLMGDDSTPRTVLSICSGQEEMYEVVPTKGEPFTVNESHILSLKASGQGRIQYVASQDRYIVHWFDGEKCTSKSFASRAEAEALSICVSKNDVFDIEVRDYIGLNDQAKHILKSYWAPIDYSSQEVPIEPRFLGLWLGDGHATHTCITTIDVEVMNYLNDFAKRENMRHVIVQNPQKAPLCRLTGLLPYSGTSRINHLLDRMRGLGVIGNKHIPLIYKANSRQVRLELLAGLIDSDGYYSRGCYEITQKRKTLAYDIQDVCRSLGFACFVCPVIKSCIYKGEKRGGTYYRVSFSGDGLDEIPVLLERKRGEVRTQKKNALVTGFELKPLGVGDYYGFEIDGNRRFLLGSHMVTHNTLGAVYLSLTLGLKTMVICHFDVVRRQWPGEYAAFSGDSVKVQLLSGKTKLDPDADVYIAGVQKAGNMSAEDFAEIGTVIIDEAHIATATAFTKTLLKFTPRYLIGLSATPDRPDGLHNLLTCYFGSRKDFIVRKEVKNFTVIKYTTDYEPEISYRVVRGNVSMDWTKVTSSLALNKNRQEEIARIAISHPEQKIIILSDRVEQSEGIYEILKGMGESVELLVGTRKTWDKTKRILVAGTKKGGVGLNDPELTMLILASDAKDVRQFEGRIRTTDNLVYDVVDKFSTLENHWKLRKKWYEGRGATVVLGGTKREGLPRDPEVQKRFLNTI